MSGNLFSGIIVYFSTSTDDYGWFAWFFSHLDTSPTVYIPSMVFFETQGEKKISKQNCLDGLDSILNALSKLTTLKPISCE